MSNAVTRQGTPTIVALDVKHQRAWEDTRTALLWHCPAFSHIFYTMMNKQGSEHIAVFTTDVPIAATDGSSLMLNPDPFFAYNLHERLFIVAHEIMHCILGHMEMAHSFRTRQTIPLPSGKTLPYDHQTMNRAMDYVINDILVESKVGKFNKDWLHDTAIATARDSVIDTYAKLFKKQQGGGGGQGPGQQGQGQQGQGQGQFDQHLPPGTSQGKDPTTAAQERSDFEWKAAVAAGAHAAKVQGKLPASLERILSEVLDPQVDWREHIQTLFARMVGSETVNWRRPERRYIVNDIYAPESAGFGADLVVVAIDTSGSVGQRELDMFFAELQGILEDVRPEVTRVIWCDAKVHRVDDLTDVGDLQSLRLQRAPGGGGTDFRPVFDYVANHETPDALVYLTDGYGSFPEDPGYPVIWGDIANNPNYPFGQVVRVPKSD